MPKFWIEILLVFFFLDPDFSPLCLSFNLSIESICPELLRRYILSCPSLYVNRDKIDGKLPVLLSRDEALVFICVHAFVQAHALLASQKMKVFLIGAENVEKNITQCSQEERKTLSGTQFRRHLFCPSL